MWVTVNVLFARFNVVHDFLIHKLNNGTNNGYAALHWPESLLNPKRHWCTPVHAEGVHCALQCTPKGVHWSALGTGVLRTAWHSQFQLCTVCTLARIIHNTPHYVYKRYL